MVRGDPSVAAGRRSRRVQAALLAIEGRLPRGHHQVVQNRNLRAVLSRHYCSSLVLLGMSEMTVRMPLCRTAEKSNIPWREMTKEVLESDVYEVFERIQDPNLVYPDCELTSAFLSFLSVSLIK